MTDEEKDKAHAEKLERIRRLVDEAYVNVAKKPQKTKRGKRK